MRMLVAIWAIGTLAGCGGSAVNNPTWQAESAVPTTGAGTPADMRAEAAPTSDNLPDAPWTTETVDGTAVPAELMRAWASADNREWCAPIVVEQLDGSRVRPAEYAGGWAVEFDKRGLPGVQRNGRACTNCGRGAFGLAGTAVMVDDEDPTEAEERSFRDGSRVRLESGYDEESAEGPNGHVATLKIAGQDCVYQVWSFVSDEHLEELIRSIRFVQPARD